VRSDCIFWATNDLARRKKTVEHRDGLGDGVSHTSKTWNDGNIARPIVAKLPERYERGELHPHIHFTVGKGSSDFKTCYGVFANAHHLDEVRLWALLGDGTDDSQFPMLIKAVHVMKDKQDVVRPMPLRDSVIWLQRLDDCAGLITDALYFSAELSKFVGSRRPRAEDWKFNRAGFLGSVSGLPQKFPNEVVKGGPVRVKYFADEGCNAGGDDLLTPEVLELFDALGIAFHDFAVSPFIQKSVDFEIKVLDVLIGPLESFSDPFQWMRHIENLLSLRGRFRGNGTIDFTAPLSLFPHAYSRA
jgi:hypothetical protein